MDFAKFAQVIVVQARRASCVDLDKLRRVAFPKFFSHVRDLIITSGAVPTTSCGVIIIVCVCVCVFAYTFVSLLQAITN